MAVDAVTSNEQLVVVIKPVPTDGTANNQDLRKWCIEMGLENKMRRANLACKRGQYMGWATVHLDKKFILILGRSC